MFGFSLWSLLLHEQHDGMWVEERWAPLGPCALMQLLSHLEQMDLIYWPEGYKQEVQADLSVPSNRSERSMSPERQAEGECFRT